MESFKRLPHTSAGPGRVLAIDVGREPVEIEVENGREVSLRNTRMSTLWVSFDGQEWVDIASGTSFGPARLKFDRFYARTSIGRTQMRCLVTS